MMIRPTAKPASNPADNTSINHIARQKKNKKTFHPRNTKLTVVLGPPAKVSPADDIVEQIADKHPGNVVERRRGGHATRAGEDEREVEVLEEFEPELLVQSPLYKRCNGPSEEEKDEAIVELTLREQTLWSNDTPL